MESWMVCGLMVANLNQDSDLDQSDKCDPDAYQNGKKEGSGTPS
jgi:hypothetical protein